MESFFKKNILRAIKQSESPPRVINNFLTQKEVNELIAIEENATGYFVNKDEGRRTSLGINGSIAVKNDRLWHPKIRKILLKKLKNVLGEFIVKDDDYPPHFFRTKFPNKIHADTGRDPNVKIYKQILLPLKVNPNNCRAHTILFKNKWYGQASNFVGYNTNKSEEQNHSTILDDRGKFVQFKDVSKFYDDIKNQIGKTINYNNGKFTITENFKKKVKKRVSKPTDDSRYNKMTNKHITNKKLFSKEIFKKYLNHQDYNDLTGLELDYIYEWKVGDILIWDRTQLHSSDDYRNFGVTEKLGLAIFTCSP